MLPFNAQQISYQEIYNTTWKHKERIESYIKHLNLEYDLVLCELRHGVSSGSIISNFLQKPLGVIEVIHENGITSILWPHNIDKNEKLQILLVDTVCNTGISMQDMKEAILKDSPRSNIYTYATFVAQDNNQKPEIIGEIISDFIQTPYKWLSFTHQSQLERLEKDTDRIFNLTEHSIAVSSDMIFVNLEVVLGKEIDKSKIRVYQNFAANKDLGRTNYGLRNLELKDYRNKGIDVYFGTLQRVIEEKANFITKNGVTHFIEENLEEATVLALLCPISHIIYLEKKHFIRISNYRYPSNNLKI